MEEKSISEIQIDTEFTPNPHSLKFNINRELIEKGTAFFAAREEAKGSPLAEKLFEVPSVDKILISRDFVTVTRDPSVETWSRIIPAVTHVLQEHCQSGQPAVASKAGAAAPSKGVETEIEKKIKQILDEKVRPAVAQDGGDIIFHSFREGVVRLHLQGSCSSCPSSTATLKAGIERLLCEMIPEVKEVVQV